MPRQRMPLCLTGRACWPASPPRASLHMGRSLVEYFVQRQERVPAAPDPGRIEASIPAADERCYRPTVSGAAENSETMQYLRTAPPERRAVASSYKRLDGDVQGSRYFFADHIPDYRNLMGSLTSAHHAANSATESMSRT
jgi:hypothetical protein